MQANLSCALDQGTYPALVLRRREIVVCPQSAQQWYANEQPLCQGEKNHEHQRFEVHVHRDLVELSEGISITAVSFDAGDPYARASATDFGLYLDTLWKPPWSHGHVAWPDFELPADPGALVSALEDLLTRARAGQVVELGCLGGHGRTGTALACLATLTGRSPRDAVSWVRANYCAMAVETCEQEDFVISFPCGA
ncbi:MAG TPA: hypothetical protein VIH06_00875 [Ilumatobacteraceae bacterium]